MINYALRIFGLANAINVEKALLNTGAIWINDTRDPFFTTFNEQDEVKHCNLLYVIWDDNKNCYVLSYFPGSPRITGQQILGMCSNADIFLEINKTLAKQVCIWRKDLKVRTGKKMAQSGHAFESHKTNIPYEMFSAGWFYEQLGHRKVVVDVDNEEQLLQYQNQLQDFSIPHTLITDSGFTEFNGIPTNTCIGIHPIFDEDVNHITGKLSLY